MFLQEWVNHVFCFSPLSLMIFITTTKLLSAVSGAMPSMICFMGISKALLHSLFSLHLSWSIFILQYKQKLAHEKKILWNTCMTLAGSSIWRCCPNEAVYNLCFCNHDCSKNDLGWCMALVGGGLLCAMFIYDICSSKVYMFFSHIPGTPRYWYWCTIATVPKCTHSKAGTKQGTKDHTTINHFFNTQFNLTSLGPMHIVCEEVR